MHPGYMWWKQMERNSCGPIYANGCFESAGGRGRGREWSWTFSSRGGDPIFGSAGFGMRRPVRFLAERLELDGRQLSKLARIIEQIRIEREQAAVDLRRAAGELADALEGSDFESDTAEAGGQRRVDAARSVQSVVSRSLRELHDLLDADQREELASLIRTGSVKL